MDDSLKGYRLEGRSSHRRTGCYYLSELKVRVKVNFALKQVTKAQREGKSTALIISLTSALNVMCVWWGGGMLTPRLGSFALGKVSVHTVQESGWATGTAPGGVGSLTCIP